MSNFVFIKEDFFKENSGFEEMLDPFDLEKQTARQYLYVNVKYNDNNILVPLRRNIGKSPKLYYPVPSKTRPNAGLDYRKMLIVNNEDYIEIPSGQRLAESQTKIISDNYDTIEKAVNAEYKPQEDYFGSDRVVDDLVRRIRKKMPKVHINTLYGFGYRLI